MTMCGDGLVKVIEECGELTQIAAKKLAYFTTDSHPDGAGSMRERLENEIADVTAACRLVIQTLGLDSARIEQRADRKFRLFITWHEDKTV